LAKQKKRKNMIKIIGIPFDANSSFLKGPSYAPQRIRLMDKEGSANRFADFVKDCIHDLFIHVWEKRQSLTHVKVPRFYLLGALRNQILKEIQQQKGARKTELMEDDYILDVEFALLEDQPLYDKMSIICDAINAQYQVLDGQIVVLSSGCK
jgi:hypothetical protein